MDLTWYGKLRYVEKKRLTTVRWSAHPLEQVQIIAEHTDMKGYHRVRMGGINGMKTALFIVVENRISFISNTGSTKKLQLNRNFKCLTLRY